MELGLRRKTFGEIAKGHLRKLLHSFYSTTASSQVRLWESQKSDTINFHKTRNQIKLNENGAYHTVLLELSMATMMRQNHHQKCPRRNIGIGSLESRTEK